MKGFVAQHPKMIICQIPILDEDEHILAIQLASERRPLKGSQTGNLTSEANSNASCTLSKFKKSKKNFSKITRCQ